MASWYLKSQVAFASFFCFSAIHFGFPQLPTVFHRVSWEPFTTSSGASEPAWRTAEAPLAGHQNWTAAPWRFVRSLEKSWKVWGGDLADLVLKGYLVDNDNDIQIIQTIKLLVFFLESVSFNPKKFRQMCVFFSYVFIHPKYKGVKLKWTTSNPTPSFDEKNSEDCTGRVAGKAGNPKVCGKWHGEIWGWRRRYTIWNNLGFQGPGNSPGRFNHYWIFPKGPYGYGIIYPRLP